MIKIRPEQVKVWVMTNFPDAKPRKNGSELRICNPFDGDTDYHLNLSVRGAHDWHGDGWAGKYKPSFLRFVQLYRRCSFAQAIKEVCGTDASLKSLELKLRDQHKIEENEPDEVLLELPKGSQKIIGSSQPKIAATLIAWLRSRGVDEAEIEQYQLHHFADTVIWPYLEYGLTVYWQSRNCQNKVFNFPDSSTGLGKTMFFYGFDMVEPDDYMIITEAIFGAHTLGTQCVASGGAILGERQILKLRVLNPVRGLILAPDNDRAGLQSLVSNYGLIHSYYPVFHSIPPRVPYQEDGETKYTKDWNDLLKVMSKQEVREIFEENVARTRIQDINRINQFTRVGV